MIIRIYKKLTFYINLFCIRSVFQEVSQNNGLHKRLMPRYTFVLHLFCIDLKWKFSTETTTRTNDGSFLSINV